MRAVQDHAPCGTPLAFLVLLAACDPATTPPPSGTSVGNPGKNTFRLASGTGLELENATGLGLGFELVACDGVAEVPIADEDTDLLGGDAVSFSGLEWCAVVVTADRVLFAGVGSDPEAPPFDITLAIGVPLTLWTAAPIAVDGESFVLELGSPGWITADSLGLGFEEVVVTPDSEIHDLVLTPLVEQTAWYLDEDDDGDLSPAERSAGPVAATAFAPPPEMRDPVPDDTGEAAPDSVGVDGCNCGTTAPAGGWLAAALLLVVRRRR